MQYSHNTLAQCRKVWKGADLVWYLEFDWTQFGFQHKHWDLRSVDQAKPDISSLFA